MWASNTKKNEAHSQLSSLDKNRMHIKKAKKPSQAHHFWECSVAKQLQLQRRIYSTVEYSSTLVLYNIK